MHFEHDKHQYFFEKFLRNEMHGDELEAFQAKLADNERFRKDFDFYVSNRSHILKEELAEYDENEILISKPQRFGWFYVTISVLGLVLIIDYYLSANYDKTVQVSRRRKPLIERINIFKSDDAATEVKDTDKSPKENKPGHNQPKILSAEPEESDSAALFEEAEIQLEKYFESNNTVQSDYFLMDSMMYVFDGSFLSDRIVTLNMQTDSMLDDSKLHMLAFRSLYGKPRSSQKQLFVEYWRSPIHFRGYKFSGKKLLLFGFDTGDALFFTYDEPGNAYHLFLMNREYHLYSDNQFHKISKE